jgi:hypothetical protein
MKVISMKNIIYLFAISIVIFYSSLNAQWVETGLTNANVRAFAVLGMNLFAGSNDGGVFLSTNNGANWTPIGLANTYVSAFAVRDNNLFAGTGSGVFLSTNKGTSWTAVDSGLIGFHANFVYALAVSDTNLFAATYGNVFLSTNNGTSWTEADSGLQYGQPPGVMSFAVSGADIFAGNNGNGVFLSTNNGTSWAPSLASELFVGAFAVSGTNLFVGTDSGVFRSTNNGTSWSEANTGLPKNTYVGAFAVNGKNLFAGTWGTWGDGVFLSTNNGMNWTAVNSGLPPSSGVSSLTVSGTNLFAAILGVVVWRRPLSEIITSVSEIAGSTLPMNFELKQNYPNPFNPSTIIKYQIPTAGIVSLKVYDVLGKEVAALVNEEKPVGNYQVEFDGSKLSSRIYFYKLQTGAFVESKKMILMK